MEQQQQLQDRLDQIERRLQQEKSAPPEAVIVATGSQQLSTQSWIMFGVFVFLILVSIIVPIVITQVQNKKIQKAYMQRLQGTTTTTSPF